MIREAARADRWRLYRHQQAVKPKTEEPTAPLSEARSERAASIANRLTQLRRENDHSQETLGRLIGASQATVSRWEDPQSPSTPSALELVELATHFRVDVAWIVGSKSYRDVLPVGETMIDQALLDKFDRAESAEELDRLFSTEMPFGTIWVQIPEDAEIVSMQEAVRRVKQVDRRVRDRHPDLWHEWARIVLS